MAEGDTNLCCVIKGGVMLSASKHACGWPSPPFENLTVTALIFHRYNTREG